MPHFPPEEVRRLRTDLLNWYRRFRRDLPWRRNPSPYRVWVSEIMLQQTQVRTVIHHFERFLGRFPSIISLAEASVEEVCAAWSGLGYYRRARNLHQAARTLVEQHNYLLPKDLESLLALPGIGRYTAGAILSIAFQAPYPAVDANARRILRRLRHPILETRNGANGKDLELLAKEIIEPSRPGDFNQALMDLGASICLPDAPNCLECPLRRFCNACRQGCPGPKPVRNRQKPTPVRLVASVVLKASRVLLIRDALERWYPDLWRFPFRIVEERQSPGEAADLLIADDLCLQVLSLKEVMSNRFQITRHRIEQTVYLCEAGEGRIPSRLGRRSRWLRPEYLCDVGLPSSQKPILEPLKDVVQTRSPKLRP